jgi:hypothetical protein
VYLSAATEGGHTVFPLVDKPDMDPYAAIDTDVRQADGRERGGKRGKERKKAKERKREKEMEERERGRNKEREGGRKGGREGNLVFSH